MTAGRNRRFVVTCALVLLSILFCVPFYWLLRSSFMDMIDIFVYPPIWWPDPLLMDNYKEVLFSSVPIFTYFRNTMTVMAGVLSGVLITSTLSGYGFARIRFPLRNLWFACVLSGMMLPGAVTLIPSFLMWKELNGINTLWPLIVPAWFGGGAFNIFLMRQFFLTIPKEIEEAVFIDGAGHWTIFSRIFLPLVQPALIVVGLFCFLGTWNDFFTPLIYLYDMEKYTLALGLQVFNSAYGNNWGAVMAAATLVTVPAVAVFFAGQKYFVEGIVMSGIKG